MSSGLWGYVARRAIFLPPLLIGLSIVMFSLIHLAPGDPVIAMMGERAAANPDFVKVRQAQLGLDKPLPVQYLYWLRRMLQGDFGKAYTFNNTPVIEPDRAAVLDHGRIANGRADHRHADRCARRDPLCDTAILGCGQHGYCQFLYRSRAAEFLAGAAAAGLDRGEIGLASR